MVDGVGLDGDAGETEVDSQGGDDQTPEKSVLDQQTVQEDVGTIGPTTDPASNESQKNQKLEGQGDKPAEGEKPSEEVETPADEVEEEYEEYDLEVSADSPLTQEEVDAIAQYASDNGLSKEAAENFLKVKEEAKSNGIAISNLQAENEANRKALLELPEFSADNLEETKQTIREVVEKFGDDDLKALMTGPAGNHPGLAKLMLKIGKSMKSDDIVGKGSDANQVEETGTLKSMYPEFYK